MVRYSYDIDSDCGYIRIGDGDVAGTESLSPSLHVDRDGSDEIVGIEVLTVTDRRWIQPVASLLAERVPDASIVVTGFRDIAEAGAASPMSTTHSDSAVSEPEP